MSFRFTIISLLCLLGSWSFSKDKDYEDKHVEAALRMIGHQLLLHTGDSTLRVLPVEFKDDQYFISFESELTFLPEDLVKISNDVLVDYEFDAGYILEVRQCTSQDVVYNYEEFDPQSPDLISCQGRLLPTDCYQLVYEFNSPKMVGETYPFVFEEEHTNMSNIYKWMIGLLAVILLLTILLRRNKSNTNANPNKIKLGNYIFDKGSGKLILNEQQVELTGKENDLLSLLYQSANNTVKREEILSKVWGDEGDYVGRTLDVFVSKLRKKLELDESVQIANIRGVGYKLVVDLN